MASVLHSSSFWLQPSPSPWFTPSFPGISPFQGMSHLGCQPLGSLAPISTIILSSPHPLRLPLSQSNLKLVMWINCTAFEVFNLPLLFDHLLSSRMGLNNFTAKTLISEFSPVNLPQHFLTISYSCHPPTYTHLSSLSPLTYHYFIIVTLLSSPSPSLFFCHFCLVKPQSVMTQPPDHDFCAYTQTDEYFRRREMQTGSLAFL